jgi:hypothetical protein
MPSDNNILMALMQRARMWLAGVQFGGRRDLYQILGYQRFPLHMDYVARYLRQDITKRIIDAPVLATWADPPEVDGGDAFNEAWQALVSDLQLGLYQKIIRLDKLAGLGAFAGMVVGFNDGSSLEEPVKAASTNKVLYMAPYAEAAIKVDRYVTDKNNPRYGLPELYTVNPGRFQADIRVGTLVGQFTSEIGRPPFNVHYSRFLHVAEGLLEDQVFGRSRLENVINLLDDLLKVVGGSAEIFWLIANRGMQIDIDKEMELDDDDQAALSQEIEDYQMEIRRFIRTRGVKINKLGSDPVDPRGVFSVIIQALSAATGIPQSILVGAAIGSLASQQDRGNWSDRIGERVTEYAEPSVLIPLIALLINAGCLPQPDMSAFNITWPEAFKMNPLERAQTSAQMARSAANLTKTMSLLQPKAAQVGPDGQEISPAQPAQTPLFSRDEMRNIVGFGKKMPVFDSKEGTNSQTTDATDVGGDDPDAATTGKQKNKKGNGAGTQASMDM